ncbi:MAG: hypothetical protein ACLP5H_23350 [Desulfomonilaceae bacterium]
MAISTADRVLEMFSSSKRKLEAKIICDNENGRCTEYTEGGNTVAFRFEYPDGRVEVKKVLHDYTKDFRG